MNELVSQTDDGSGDNTKLWIWMKSRLLLIYIFFLSPVRINLIMVLINDLKITKQAKIKLRTPCAQ